MLKDITHVEGRHGYVLRIRFEDGVEGEVDIAKLITFEGVFAELRDRKKFALVKVDTELGTIVWPNGADLDPDVLYAHICGTPLSHSDRS